MLLLLGTLAFAQENSKVDSAYLKQVKIYNSLKKATLTSVNHCNNNEVLLVTKEGKLLKYDGKLLVSKQSKCLFEIFDVEIKSIHPDSINKNINFVELNISYSIKANSQLPDTLSFKFISPASESNNNANNKRGAYDKKLIIIESPVSGLIKQEIKLKDFINGQYILLFEYKKGETHEFGFELNSI